METQEIKTTNLQKVVSWIKSKGYRKIKANTEGFEVPTSYSRPKEDEIFIPDATAMRQSRKMYFEVAVKTEDMKPLIRKWKLLSTLASVKNGKLFLFAPRGHKAFAERIVKEKMLNAEVISI